jgi:hypothetical protein
MVSFTPRPLYFRGRSRPVHVTSEDGCPRSGLDIVERRWNLFSLPGMGYVADKVALGQGSSEYFDFPYHSFHRLLDTPHHPSSGAGTICQIVTEVPSGHSLTLSQGIKNGKRSLVQFSTRNRVIPSFL